MNFKPYESTLVCCTLHIYQYHINQLMKQFQYDLVPKKPDICIDCGNLIDNCDCE